VQDHFGDLYDEITLAALECGPHDPPPPRPVATGWRANVGAAALTVVASTALGVRDVLEPREATPIIEEIDMATLRPRDDAPVAYYHVPGHPKASRAVVRGARLGHG
jgi:hypothetical protein